MRARSALPQATRARLELAETQVRIEQERAGEREQQREQWRKSVRDALQRVKRQSAADRAKWQEERLRLQVTLRRLRARLHELEAEEEEEEEGSEDFDDYFGEGNTGDDALPTAHARHESASEQLDTDDLGPDDDTMREYGDTEGEEGEGGAAGGSVLHDTEQELDSPFRVDDSDGSALLRAADTRELARVTSRGSAAGSAVAAAVGAPPAASGAAGAASTITPVIAAAVTAAPATAASPAAAAAATPQSRDQATGEWDASVSDSSALLSVTGAATTGTTTGRAGSVTSASGTAAPASQARRASAPSDATTRLAQ